MTAEKNKEKESRKTKTVRVLRFVSASKEPFVCNFLFVNKLTKMTFDILKLHLY